MESKAIQLQLDYQNHRVSMSQWAVNLRATRVPPARETNTEIIHDRPNNFLSTQN